MPASLYFVGFTGGTLTIGVVGVIAGPLVVALLVEVVELVTNERGTVQQTLDDPEIGDDPPDDPDERDDPAAGDPDERSTTDGDASDGGDGLADPTVDPADG